VICSAPNWTVSPTTTSKLVIRPVILSSPENTPALLVTFSVDGPVTTSSASGGIGSPVAVVRGGGSSFGGSDPVGAGSVRDCTGGSAPPGLPVPGCTPCGRGGTVCCGCGRCGG